MNQRKLSVVLMLFGLTSIFLNISAASEPVWDGNKVELKLHQLGEGVFAFYDDNASEFESKGLPLATSGGFVVGQEGILMVDTMLNKRLYEQAISLIRTKSSKPILFAVNTSYHGDHSYGNMYLPESALIIQHEVTSEYIRDHFVKDTEFMIQNFGQGRGIEEIVPVDANVLIGNDSQMSINLGSKRVEIIDFGFAQTGGDLFVWEADSQTLWTGNPIITVKPSLPWLLDGHLLETLASLQKVYDFLPEEAQVVPGHGSPMKKSDLKWHINYLNDIKTEVQAAIDDGLSLEQTVERVKLPEYEGYALHGWVHPSLNVPAAYKDLSK